jgi:hypothetical protein
MCRIDNFGFLLLVALGWWDLLTNRPSSSRACVSFPAASVSVLHDISGKEPLDKVCGKPADPCEGKPVARTIAPTKNMPNPTRAAGAALRIARLAVELVVRIVRKPF